MASTTNLNENHFDYYFFINAILLGLLGYLLISDTFSRSMVLLIMLVDCYISKYFETNTFIENIILSIIIKK